MATSNTLAEAIKNAEEKVSPEGEVKEAKQEKQEVKEEKQEPEEKEEKEEEPEETDLTEEEILHARNLYKALKDPNSSKAIIETLAKTAGVIKTEEKKEEVVETILDIFKNALPEEFKFMADGLLPAIEKVVAKLAEGQLKSVKDEVKSLSEDKVAAAKAKVTEEVNAAYEEISKLEHFEAVKGNIESLMKKFPPSKDVTAKEYFNSMYVLAVGQKGLTVKSSEKISRNRSDAAERLESNKGGKGAKSGTPGPSEKMSLNKAIEAAEAALRDEI